MVTALINKLKQKEEDFEFYPTTNEIINDLIKEFKPLITK